MQGMCKPFSLVELQSALKASKDRSAPGEDGVDYCILRALPKEFKECLLHIYNEILETGSFPAEWKRFGVFFIPKKDSNKFRPISLAQCTLKTMERMVKNRLYRWLEKEHILPNSQHGFRNDRSCIDNLAILISDINLEWYERRDTCAVFLDIKGAFDNVLGDILIEKLIKIKVPIPMVKFIANLISEREVFYRN